MRIVAVVLVCDQISKAAARAVLEPGVSYPMPGGVLRLWRIENPGAFLSLGAELSPALRNELFVTGLGVVLIVSAVWLLRTSGLSRGSFVAAALVLAGGTGNWIDRLTRDGLVTDFAVLAAGPLHTGVFNVADVAITGGVLFLLAFPLRERRRSYL